MCSKEKKEGIVTVHTLDQRDLSLWYQVVRNYLVEGTTSGFLLTRKGLLAGYLSSWMESLVIQKRMMGVVLFIQWVHVVQRH